MTISQNRFNVPFIVLKLQKILLIIRKRELGRRNFFVNCQNYISLQICKTCVAIASLDMLEAIYLRREINHEHLTLSILQSGICRIDT